MSETNFLKNSGFVAEWSGCYPSLCHGEWTLYYKGEKLKTRKPLTEPFGTFKEYSSWTFGGESGWEEEWDSEFYGLHLLEWAVEFSGFIRKLFADNGIEMTSQNISGLFNAIREQDWQKGSCGGCI